MECDNSAFTYHHSSQTNWFGNQHSSSIPCKRKRYENGGCFPDTNGSGENEHAKPFPSLRAGRFIRMLPNRGIFQSESWKPNGSTLYHPVSKNLLVNFDKYDQISFDEGFFFIGDESGGCLQKEQGQVIHCWRFDEKEKTLFIALSFLITDFCIYQEIARCLNCAEL
ncbi:uncharacterized protein WCC33_013238 [Rhinophrynus dorsalis]